MGAGLLPDPPVPPVFPVSPPAGTLPGSPALPGTFVGATVDGTCVAPGLPEVTAVGCDAVWGCAVGPAAPAFLGGAEETLRDAVAEGLGLLPLLLLCDAPGVAPALVAPSFRLEFGFAPAVPVARGSRLTAVPVPISELVKSAVVEAAGPGLTLGAGVTVEIVWSPSLTELSPSHPLSTTEPASTPSSNSLANTLLAFISCGLLPPPVKSATPAMCNYSQALTMPFDELRRFSPHTHNQAPFVERTLCREY